MTSAKPGKHTRGQTYDCCGPDLWRQRGGGSACNGFDIARRVGGEKGQPYTKWMERKLQGRVKTTYQNGFLKDAGNCEETILGRWQSCEDGQQNENVREGFAIETPRLTEQCE